MKQIHGERHHIKPRSLYPELTKDKDNIVKLTYKEHYVCHHLLYKIYEELNDKNTMYKMVCAWMRLCKNKNGVHVNQHQYKIARLAYSKICKGKHLSEEHKKKISESVKLKLNTEEVKKRHIEGLKGHLAWNKGKNLSEEHKKKISEGNKGKEISEEHRKKISESNKGMTSWIKGKHMPEDAKKKISESLKGEKHPAFGAYWWTNGEATIRGKECPGDGWVRGRKINRLG